MVIRLPKADNKSLTALLQPGGTGRIFPIVRSRRSSLRALEKIRSRRCRPIRVNRPWLCSAFPVTSRAHLFGIYSNGMWRLIGVDIAAGVLLIAAWYCVFRHLNRKRGRRVLQWIERAFAGHGDVTAVEWLSASRMQVRMRLMECGFNQLSILVSLLPRETPLQWIASRLKKSRETLTFQGDLPCAPNFNLDVQNHRWCGRSRRKLVPSKDWSLSRVGPFVLTSRPDWQRDIDDYDGCHLRLARLQLHAGQVSPHQPALQRHRPAHSGDPRR